MGAEKAVLLEKSAGVNMSPGKNNDKILTNTLWTQNGTVYISINGKQTALSGVNYNDFCPYYYVKDSTTGKTQLSSTRAVTGCTNTTDAQILYYWMQQGYEFNFNITADDWFEVLTISTTETSQVVSMNDVSTFKAGDLETINTILSSSDYQTSEFIAALNYFCGIKNHSLYGNSTGTYVYHTDDYLGEWNLLVYNALEFDSHYSISCLNTDFFTTDATGNNSLTELGYSILRECLDYGEVITVSIPGHSIYLDGYRFNTATGEYEYHLNYGWGINAKETKWYTEEEMVKENIVVVGIDITPNISAFVSNTSAEYNAGTMLRALERINHTLNETSVTVEFASDLTGSTSIQQEAFSVNAPVNTIFNEIGFNLVFTSNAGITNEKAITLTEITGNLILNNGDSDAVLVEAYGDEALTVTVDGGGVFAGSNFNTNDIISALDDFASSGFDAVAQFVNSASADAFSANNGDDSITITGNSIVAGNIDLGGGTNIITINSGSTWYGNLNSAAEIHMVLDSQTNEAFTVIANDLGTFCDNASIYVSMDKFTLGTYTLVDASRYSANNALLANLTVVVTSGGVTETLNLNNGETGRIASIYIDGGKLNLTDASNPSTPDEYTGVWLYSSGAVEIGTSMFEKTLSAGGYDSMYVGSDGIADTTRIGSGGIMHILEEGFALYTEVTGSGNMEVSSGGSATGTLIQSSGRVAVLSGGEIETTNVANQGILDVSSYASAYDTRILQGGTAVVKGKMNETQIDGGTLLVSSGGTAESSYITSGGNLTILAAGTAYDTTVEKDGTLHISNGGKATGVVLEEGTLRIHSMGSAVSAAVYENGNIYVEQGGTLVSGSVEYQGALSVRSGGYAQDIQVNSWGSMHVFSKGSAADVEVFSGGVVTVDKGGNIQNITLEDGDLSLKGGTVNNVTLNNGGNLHISSAGKANGGAVYSSGFVKVSSGAVVSSLVIHEGGSMEVAGSGVIRLVTVSSGGSTYLQNGAEFIDIITKAGGIVNGFTMKNDTTLTGKNLSVSNCLVVNEAILEKGQSANQIVIDGGAELNVHNGGIITNMTASAGAIINGFILNENNFAASGVVLNNVYTNAEACLYRGQSVANAEIGADATVVVDGGEILSGIAAKGATLNGITLAEENIFSSGLHISHGIVAGSAALTGNLTAKHIIIHSSGDYRIENGSISSATIINGGTMHLSSNGTARDTVISGGGTLHVASGANVSKTVLYGGGSAVLANGAKLDTLTLASGGMITVGNGASVTRGTIFGNGALTLSSGGTAETTLIQYGGALHVYDGATASGTLVNSGAYLGVGSGAVIYDTRLNSSAKAKLWGGASAVQNTIGYAAEMTVLSGGYVESSTITTWGAIILSSGAIGNYTTIQAKAGYHIYDGAKAYTTTIAQGAFLGIGLGGTAYNLKVEKGASATFYDESILRGWSDFAGTVTVNEDVNAAGAKINFDLTGRTASDGVIITNAAGIAGASYFVSVSAGQTAGKYLLAGNAASIESLTITGTSTKLVAGGDKVIMDGNSYDLDWDNTGTLYLEVVKVASSAMAIGEDPSLGIWDDTALMADTASLSTGEQEKTPGLLAIL